MKIVLVPDSFKGTLTASEVCAIEKEIIQGFLPLATIYELPMADGGEGMLDIYEKILGGNRVEVEVTGPDGNRISSEYLISGNLAVIEMAKAAGLPLMHGKLDPLHATTYGVGELMVHAKKMGVDKILLGLGGSATNDCGAGMAAALGYSFYDEEGCQVEPLACNLGRIRTIKAPDEPFDFMVEAACDVDSPLLGEDGATYLFGSQKGVTGAMKVELEAQMANFAKVLGKHTGIDVSQMPGAGAAGGVGAMTGSLLSGRLRSGSEMLLDIAGFDALISDADLVITGEGKMDMQSMRGKLPGKVYERCRRKNIECVAICGSKEISTEMDLPVFVCSEEERPMAEIRKTCREDLMRATFHMLCTMCMK